MTTAPLTLRTDRSEPERSQAVERAALSSRVTAAARAELCQRPEELSLRAVARRAGIEPRRVGELVESREQLVANVLFEIVHDAHAAVRPSLEATVGAPCRTRVLAMSRAYRAWALANPAELRVLLAPRRRSGLDHAAAVRAMRWFYGPVLELFGDALRAGDMDLTSERSVHRAADLVHPVFLEMCQGLDPRAVSAFVTLVTGLQGHLVLETSNQLAVVFGDLERLFDVQVGALLDATGIR